MLLLNRHNSDPLSLIIQVFFDEHGKVAYKRISEESSTIVRSDRPRGVTIVSSRNAAGMTS